MLKNILMHVFTGASVAVAVMLILVGYSDRINPVSHPVLACIGMTLPFFIIINLLFLVAWVLIKWKRLWIPLLGFIVAYGPVHTYFPLHGSSKVPEGSIKVMSYNVCGYQGNKDYGNCFDSIYNYLKREKPHIVCLQEDMLQNTPTMERLAELFPFNDTVHVNHKEGYTNVLGIHTRYPIIRKERIEYKSDANGSVAFFLKVGKREVIVVNNHLESFHLNPNDREKYKNILKGEIGGKAMEDGTRTLIKKVSDAMALRAPQADAVHKYVEAHKDYPLIVCGDFNDTPISYVRHTIAQNLTDCYVETGTGAGISYNQKGFSFRIDQMMCSSHFQPSRCEVDDAIKASDHYPVKCWMMLDGHFQK
ncbi:MAG: endonuclease/exonuclease/phosphatase family protein [Prevotella sp.]|nr:endonuclease/exonuclease/phosphatase family protein [Prevotella sp.]